MCDGLNVMKQIERTIRERVLFALSLSDRALDAAFISKHVIFCKAPRTRVGAGASFPYKVYRKWMVALGRLRSEQRASYTYESTGSGTGKKRLLAGESDFAGSDSKLSDEQVAACPECWFVPSLAGAVAVVYNLPGFEGALQIPRKVLASIFRGSIKQWSELSEWNSELEGMDEEIKVAVRKDKSGTTEVFTSALASFSAEFAASPGVSSKPIWPETVHAADGTGGLARKVLLTPYSIGYISLADAKAWKTRYAKISNVDGHFVEPTSSGVQAAMDAFAGEAGSNQSTKRLHYLSIVDPQNSPAAYPIAALTYLTFNPAVLDCETLYDVVFLVYWALSDTQACFDLHIWHAPAGHGLACMPLCSWPELWLFMPWPTILLSSTHP